jgi:methylated-DNA-[protein]-cysteine S-methyltransferase
MTTHDEALIAMLLGDVRRPSSALELWLETEEGRRALGVYRRALAGLEALHGRRRAEIRPRRVLYWDSLAAPIGRVLVAVGDAGLVRVSFRRGDASFVAELRQRLDADAVRSASRTSDVVGQLRDYFGGTRRAFDLPVDLAWLTPFQRRVLEATATVPAGRVVSYGDIARRIGRPRGSRAVGQALGRNPIPIVIPCHRVVAAGGRLGGYTGGLGIKRTLLRIEGALAAAG